MVDLNRQSLDRVVPDIAFGRLAGHVRGRRLADDHRQVRPPPRGPVRARRAATTCGAASTRCRTRSTSACCAPTPAELRERLPGPRRASSKRSSRELDDDELRAGLPRPRRPRPRRADRRLPARCEHDRPTVIFAYTIKGWSLPIEGHPENHSALLTVEQLRSSPSALGADADDPWAAFDAGSPEGELCAAAADGARARGAGAARAPPAVPAGARAQAPRQGVDPAGVRPLLRRPRARGARGGRARGDGEPRRGQLDQPRRLDQQVRDLVGRRAARLVRRRPADARPLARDRPAGGTSSSASPRPTWSACSASSAPPGAATASRCCRSARSTTRSSAARSSRGRSASTRAGSRSWSARRRGVSLAPEGGAHQSIVTPVDRDRPAGLHRLGAGLRPGPRVDAAARAVAARASRTASPPTSGCPPGRSTRRSTPATTLDERRRLVLAGRLPAAARRRGGRAVTLVGHGRGDARGARGRRRRSATTSTCSASPAPTCSSAPSAPAPASASTERRSSTSCFPADRAAPIVTVLDGDPNALAFLAR